VINTNLPAILHRFQVTVRFSPAVCRTLALSLGVTRANIAVSDMSLKLDSSAYIFDAKSIGVF